MARKPSALARELVRNFPKGKRRRKQRNARSDGRRAKAVKNGAPKTPEELTPQGLTELEVDSAGANGAEDIPAVEDPEAA